MSLGGKTRLDPEIAQTSVSPAIIMDNKKPPSSIQSGRRKSGGSIQLRSPVVKRPSTAPVALQGWLHKQGSEGLMLWKKRWFVLSEYCLFYYKGPEEEKLLGSILLPSYKISQCTADDKVYRKFAFKAEHANMRTYYFAAETRELMNQWINALSMASLLQEGSKLTNQGHGSAVITSTIPAKPSSNDCNFGFSNYNSCSGPITIQPTSQDRNFKEDCGNSNGWVPLNSGGPGQPLYANAPPKPKRLNSEGQYLGSSPEASPNRRNDAENILYGSHRRFQENMVPVRSQDYQYNSPYQSGYLPGSDFDPRIRSQPHMGNALAERTLDGVNWSNVKSPTLSGNSLKPEELSSNYSNSYKTDNYNLKTSQRQEGLNFSNYGSNSVNYSSASNYQHPNQYYQSYQQAPQALFGQNPDYDAANQTRKRQPPRPHSADFLDYDSKKFYPGKKHLDAKISGKPASQLDQYNSRPPRPKSSLDILHSNDGYYWSEEHYAEKMRQSAIYLQNTLPQRTQSSRANTPIARQTNDFGVAFADPGTGTNDQLSANLRPKRVTDFSKDSSKSSSRPNVRRYRDHQVKAENFMRSASARLSKVSTTKAQEIESDDAQGYAAGDDFAEGRKEESMKRLLEWKQRMLQSPLTRKSSGSSARGVAQNELSKSYKQQALKELQKQEAKSKEEMEKRKATGEDAWSQNRMSDGRLSAALSPDRYQSYSSDDEENEKSVGERVRRTPQNVKTRKDGDDAKEKNLSQGNVANLTASPDYENVARTSHESSTRRYACRSLDKIADANRVPVKDSSSFSEVERKPKKYRNEERESKTVFKCESLTLQSNKGFNGLQRKLSEQSTSKTNVSYDSFEQPERSRTKRPNWNEKIDETKLIKEFSYQYINDSETREVGSSSPRSPEEKGGRSDNLFKSRRKQLESVEVDSDSKESDAIIKEPLEVSSSNYYSNEAHISHLKSTEPSDRSPEKKKDVKFVGGGIPKHYSPTTEKQQKSVKDLLADFEKKSQLAQEREEHEKCFGDSPGKRCVFSDTETLLYDTSSDAEDKNVKPDSFVTTTAKKSESRRNVEEMDEEEQNDEVAGALRGREEMHPSVCKEDSVKRLSKTSDVTVDCSPSSEIEKLITPSYLKSTLSDSIGALENSDSACSTPTIERIKDNLTKMLPTENLNKKVSETSKKEESCEGHYMPMTPSRKVSAPPSDKSRSNSSLHSFLFGADPEETYVEMAENGGSAILLEPNKTPSSQLKKSLSDVDGATYSEVSGSNLNPHYDFLYHQRSSVLREPEYMEVNTLLEILKEQDEKLKEHKDAIRSIPSAKSSQDLVPPTPPRSALPDILNSSASQRATKSDSSDADDESSKDLDSLDIPRHPRFSLSDTFRPASYYLGGAITDRDRNILRLRNSSENHDSSDSDLVSPPPIPTSPPPLEDLDTSLETERSLDMRSHSKFKIGDVGGKKLWDSSAAESVEGDNSEQTKKKKRRPVSEDMLCTLEETEPFFFEKSLVLTELDSIGNRSGLALDDDIGDINLDQYLEDLNLNESVNDQAYAKNFSDNIYKSTEKEIHKNLITKKSTNKGNPVEKSLVKASGGTDESSKRQDTSHERSKSLEEVQYENVQTLFPPPPPELYESANENSDRERESGLAIYKNVAFPEVPPPDNYCDVYEPAEKPKVCFDPNTLADLDVKTSSGFENQGAPYYYSDIIKDEDADFGSSNSEKSVLPQRTCGHRFQPLNNQRDHLLEANQCSKRNDIGRKVNPICQNYSPSSVESNDINDVQKITAELRSTSAHFMGAADKTGTIDARNIYESDTLQRKKKSLSQMEERGAKTPDAQHLQGVARNLYPQGSKDNSSAEQGLQTKFLFVSQNRSRSRSVEGLLNDLSYFRKEKTEERHPFVEQTHEDNVRQNLVVVKRNNSCEGEDLWDKDALWRENLRKVSLRHTRSLDNLDEDQWHGSGQQTNSATQASEQRQKYQSGRRSVDHFAVEKDRKGNVCPTGRRSADHFSKSKLSRNVTYVNDIVRPKNSVGPKVKGDETYRLGESNLTKKESDIGTVVELSESDVLDCDGVHYEKLVRIPRTGDREGDGLRHDRKTDRKRSDFSKRNQPLGKELSPNVDRAPLFPENVTEGPCDGSTNDRLQLEPADGEKSSQWNMMSGGTVVEAKNATTSSDVGDSNLNKLKDPISEFDFGEYVVVERRGSQIRPLESAPSSEASGSGSVMREPLSPALTSAFLLPRSSEHQSPHKVSSSLAPATAISTSDSIKGDNLEQKLIPAENSFLDFTDRIEYYDRSPDLPNSSNDHNYRTQEDYGSYAGENFSEERKDLIMATSERGKFKIENGHYIDRYQDRNIGGHQIQNLTMESGLPTPVNVHVYGRSLDGPEARGHRGKENSAKRKISPSTWGLDVSAGELLGRTHEELVLLLIQLRRQSASVCKAMETCHIEIEEQARLAELDASKRMEHIRKLEKLKKHLLELEKQYEKGKPLVNLVDNMVKLGSLYKGNSLMYNGTIGLDHRLTVREKLEFNQKVQEQRLLAEERRDWDRLSSDHGQLQAKVQQLYKLDRLLQEESGTLHVLQQDKELLEKALGGLRHKLQVNRSNPIEADRCRKQQKLIEKELSRVRLLLAHNSKKLEETVAENARLEQELVILRQKLQAGRVNSRNSVPSIPESTTMTTAAILEAELRRVQHLVGDLQRQRHELSAQVKQLTEKSDTLVQQIRPGPTGVAGAGPIPGKKKSSATWLETDLDLLVTQDVGIETQVTSPQLQQQPIVMSNSRNTVPIYINTDSTKKVTDSMNSPAGDSTSRLSLPGSSSDESNSKAYCTPVELSEADEKMKRFYGIIPKEKQEIKTVRIVKRESERRQRDRDRSGNIGIPISNVAVAKRVSVIEENDGYGLGKVEEESYDPVQGSPGTGDPRDETKNPDYKNQDPYLNFHPTNPFLPKNLAANNLDEVLMVDVNHFGKRCLSLPRGFGKNETTNWNQHQNQQQQQQLQQKQMLNKFDMNQPFRNNYSRRNRMSLENHVQNGSGNDSSPNSPKSDQIQTKSFNNFYSTSSEDYLTDRRDSEVQDPGQAYAVSDACVPGSLARRLRLEPKEPDTGRREKASPEMSKPLTAREQLFGSGSCLSDETSPQLSPVYQSEAAREIIMEMSTNLDNRLNGGRTGANRRQVRKEKRRHHTVSNIRHLTDSVLLKMGSTRSRDDLDMERALRPRINAPDVVRSTMNHKDLKYNESTIDSILGTPNKIVIPERYIPEQEPLLTAEEQMQRSRKAESIRKMLSETTALSTPDLSSEGLEEERKSCTLRKKVEEEKKQREHLLELNQILAQQVMEKSKLVAVKAMALNPFVGKENDFDEKDLSPVQPLPIYQQRENFFS